MVTDLRQLSEEVPLTTRSMGEIMKSISLIPSLQLQLKQSGSGLKTEIADIVNVVQGLMALRPDVSSETAILAFRQALAGRFTGLTRSFGINAGEVAGMSGMTQQQLTTSGGSQIFKALETFQQSVAPTGTIEDINAQLSKRLQLVQNTLDNFRIDAGNAGLYDSVVAGVNKVLTALQGFEHTAQYTAEIQRIGQTMGEIADKAVALGEKAGTALNKFFFPAEGFSNTEALFRSIGNVLVWVKERLDDLDRLLDENGPKWRTLAEAIQNAAGKVQAAAPGAIGTGAKIATVGVDALGFAADHPVVAAAGTAAASGLALAGSMALFQGLLGGAGRTAGYSGTCRGRGGGHSTGTPGGLAADDREALCWRGRGHGR